MTRAEAIRDIFCQYDSVEWDHGDCDTQQARGYATAALEALGITRAEIDRATGKEAAHEPQ